MVVYKNMFLTLLLAAGACQHHVMCNHWAVLSLSQPHTQVSSSCHYSCTGWIGRVVCITPPPPPYMYFSVLGKGSSVFKERFIATGQKEGQVWRCGEYKPFLGVTHCHFTLLSVCVSAHIPCAILYSTSFLAWLQMFMKGATLYLAITCFDE